eukprot:CAMPEP_0172446592 /NCGR_PEP_ID=MMETSP1065-20121228/6158_1 /TAXON_ID=265537 /ORGANISM="Amphiprora paludosa, Strain CCMP125" /LENGTH=257 /DNA_ID=CAMNT_0013197747 /DNA_START=84 /DNA_END=857 /DNA_ORIENTATION=-
MGQVESRDDGSMTIEPLTRSDVQQEYGLSEAEVLELMSFWIDDTTTTISHSKQRGRMDKQTSLGSLASTYTRSLSDETEDSSSVDSSAVRRRPPSSFREKFAKHGRSLTFKDYVQYDERLGQSQHFYLKKRTPGRSKIQSGLDWQQDPTKKEFLFHPSRNSPQDYSSIRGKVVIHNEKKWLLAEYVKHNNSDQWLKAPHGAALPFFYERKYVLVRQRVSGRVKPKPATEEPTRTFAKNLRAVGRFVEESFGPQKSGA